MDRNLFISLCLLFTLSFTFILIFHIDSSIAKAIEYEDLDSIDSLQSKNCYSASGHGNNEKHLSWGAQSSDFARIFAPEYEDGASELPRQTYSPRYISNTFMKQGKCSAETESKKKASAYFWAWGQFLTHEVTLLSASGSESLPIEVPCDDGILEGNLRFIRTPSSTVYKPYAISHREHTNENTHYIDASIVYGSDEYRAEALRTKVGGKLKSQMIEGNEYLPFNFRSSYESIGIENEFLNNGGFSAQNETFVAGDQRSSENTGTLSLQTMFLREHNRLCKLLAKKFGYTTIKQLKKNDEKLYQTARSLVIGEMQAITYNEFIPLFLGKHTPNHKDLSYDPDVRPDITHEFATAGFRIGHSMVSCDVPLIDEYGTKIGSVGVRDQFFNSSIIFRNKDFLDNIVRGLSQSKSQELDELVVEDLRSLLFGNQLPITGTDLASINLQRGRDHGLPSYNKMREAIGLPKHTYKTITSNKELQYKLKYMYGEDLNECDPWLGILIEKKEDDSMMGSLGNYINKHQFEHLVKGDKCFYSHHLTHSHFKGKVARIVDKVTLADVIAANTGISKNDPTLKPSAFVSSED